MDYFDDTYIETALASALLRVLRPDPKATRLKEIFSERPRVGEYVYAYATTVYYDWRSEVEVRRRSYTIEAVTVVHYDAGLGILHVEHQVAPDPEDVGFEWASVGERFVELIAPHDEALAIRAAVEYADAWRAKVEAAIPEPDTRTDEEVIAAFHVVRESDKETVV